mgnify:CR=1 FL=1
MQLTVPDLGAARVLVVGDVMLDRYWQGPTGRISPEAPVPVLRVEDETRRPGGAANVAMNLGALGVDVTLVGLVGNDDHASLLEAQLREGGVTPALQRVDTHPTICKLRVLSQRQQLIRLDFERPFTPAETAGLAERFSEALAQVDAVIVSDYAKGTLSEVEDLIARARQRGVPVLVDPKGTDWQRYRGATLLTPNLPEFRQVAGHAMAGDNAIEAAARRLATDLDLTALLVTRGDEGMTLVPEPGEALNLPAHAREVYDVTGAGDTVIALLGAVLATGAGMAEATALANLAASLVVAKVGTASVTVAELEAAAGHSPGNHRIVDRAALLAALAPARARGERIVMTNGCFDILHAGHVQYLESARALGDRLVVAVNDDASVARLKGDTRPVVPLAQRLAVLSALAAVDWVVAFADDTPAALIEAVCPDVLVKGGDYQPEAIAGHDAVVAAGGEVRVLEFVDGQSTSALIERIRGRPD